MGISGKSKLPLFTKPLGSQILAYDTNGNPTWVPKVIGATHANYRHSVEPQIIRGRTALKIDGLKKGSFNKMGWEVWDALRSKIYPKKIDEVYHSRINLEITSPKSSVFLVGLQIGSSVISVFKFQPMQLTRDFNSGILQFFAGSTFVREGATLFIDPSDHDIDIEIWDASMHLIRFATEV